MFSLLKPSPHPPREHRDGEPRSRREDEGPSGGRHDHEPDHEAESGQPKTSQRGSYGVECGSFLATPRSWQAFLLLAFADMLFDQCSACWENRGKGEEQAADDRPEACRDKPCYYRHRP